jgi:alpha/beta hydrolase family protein
VSATATLTGPVTGGQRGRPFSLPLTDLGSVGYVAEEFFLEGTASGYEAESGTELSVDGKWRVLASRTAPFRTRPAKTSTCVKRRSTTASSRVSR